MKPETSARPDPALNADLDIVDTFRGLAAIYVLLFHAAAEIRGPAVAAVLNYGCRRCCCASR
jgi:peptidoglycan/LPS O-acetylase OafA/YrhL